jgi:hypothetical protein
MYFYWLILQKCNFSQVQHKLPEDGSGGPKHVGANVGYFNVNFNILCLIKNAFVVKKGKFYVIKMNGATVKIENLIMCLTCKHPT